MFTRPSILAVIVLSALSSAACTSSHGTATPPDSGVSVPDTCEPQRVEACSCDVGSTGTRECRPDGSHFGSCDCTVYGRDIFVDVSGNDAASGDASTPKATLGGALAVVRGLVSAPEGLPAGGVVIWIAGGVYPFPATLTLGPEVSGSAGNPVVIRAQPGAAVRFSGGTVLPSVGFGPLDASDPLYARIDPLARAHVQVFDLRAAGITDYGAIRQRGSSSGAPSSGMELFVDGEPMRLGRWPDVDQHDAAAPQSATGSELDVYGSVSPDVTGHYVRTGEADGVSVFQRDGLVGGKQYRLSRYSWTYNGIPNRAWFLTTSSSSGPSPTDPWWVQYDGSDATNLLGVMSPNRGATGQVRFTSPSAVNHGYVETAAPATPTSFGYLQDRPRRWTSAPDAWLHGHWAYYWADYHVPMKSLDTLGKVVTVSAGPEYGIAVGLPWYAYNLLEEVTQGGEWYVDRTRGQLYFYPPYPLERASVVVSTLEGPLLKLENASHVELHGVVLEDVRGSLLQVTGGAHDRLVGVTLQNAGAQGADITGTDQGVQYALVRNVGAAGVILHGGDRATLAPGNNFIEDSDIHHVGRWDETYQAGIGLYGAGNRASHNNIHDLPATAVVFEGNEHLVELNDIHDVDRLTRDAGAIYTGHDWGYRGNIVRFNYIHEIRSVFLENGGTLHAIYLDDCVSGERVEGNIFVNIADAAVFHNGGRDNLVVGNVFVRTGGGLLVLAECVAHPPNDIPGDPANKLARIQAMHYQMPPWSVRYPALARMPNDHSTLDDPALTWLYPEGSVFSSNVGFEVADSTWMTDDRRSLSHYAARTDNALLAVSPFSDSTGKSLALTPAVLTTPGFAGIPVEQIGIR